jgi:ferrochelatase
VAIPSRHLGSDRPGVLLFNLGGPETLEDVRPFLFNLFSDPEIIRIKNNSLRRLLAWLIATTRQGKSRRLYQDIGGGSPLRKITEEQAAALQDRLGVLGHPARTYIGMRCWRPFIEEAIQQIDHAGTLRLLAFPLFPQYSVTTTGSCLSHFKQVLEERGLAGRIEVSYINSWFDEPLYIEAMAETIRAAMEKFSEQKQIHILYSAHSIPARYVMEGDPYLEQTEGTVSLINTRLGNLFPSTLAFQSKVGPVKWLEPSTKSVLQQLGREGTKKLLVVPVSFVSDHVETLQEIDILYRQIATDAGIQEFHRAAALNLSPKFIEALAVLVIRALG